MNLLEKQRQGQKGNYEQYPAILVHEYERIFTMLEQGQTSGLLLQIKDMFEIMLKLPVLVAISEIYHQKEWDQEGKRLLYSLVKKPLSLGDWREIANKLRKNKNIDENVKKVIKKIADIFNKYDLVEWRNINIGHGALKLDTDISFIEDIEEKINLIIDYFNDHEVNHIYSNFKISTKENDVSILDEEILETIQNVVVLGNEIPMFPYIFIENKQIYFYDTYYSRKKKTHMLNYTHGIRKDAHNQIHKRVMTLHKTLQKDKDLYEDMFEDEASSLDEAAYFQIERIILEEIYNEQEIMSPDYLKNWIENCLEQEKGIFLLQMERGMGKTTFTRALDELKNHTIKLKNTNVRAYYFNDTYGSKTATFAAGVTNIIKRGKKAENTPLDYEVEALEGEIEGIHTGLANKKEAMAQFLRLCSNKRRKKLLLILDGIDEVPQGQIEDIFQFIPSRDMLPKNVYILLTSRTDDELEDYTKKQLNSIQYTEKLNVFKEDGNNIQVLKDYIGKKILRLDKKELTAQDEYKIERILEICENRFLYLTALKEIATSKNEPSLDELLKEEEQIFQYYTRAIRNYYGEKYFYHIKKLLCILAIAYEPLTIREIAYLMGEEKRSFKLLGFLKDIKGFIKIERSNRESNVISISNKKLEETIRACYAGEIKELILTWYHMFDSIQEDEGENKDASSLLYDGEYYLISHILYHIKYYLKTYRSEGSFTITTGAFYKIFNLLGRYLNYNAKEYQIMRGLMGYSNLISYKAVLSDELITNTYMNQGILRVIKGEIGNSITDFLNAVHHLKEKMPKNQVENRELLAHIYYNLAISLKSVWQLKDALKYCNEAMRILEQLYKKGSLSIYRLLLDVYIERATVLEQSNRVEDAYKTVNKAVEYLEDLKQKNNLESDALIAFTYSKRGNIKVQLEDYDGALLDYEAATHILENLPKEEEFHPAELIYQYLYFGIVYDRTDRPQDAIDYYKRALEKVEELKKQQIMVNASIIFNLYNNRGQTYFNLEMYEEALGDFTEAIKILEHLRKNLEIDNAILYNYMDAYVNRAASLAEEGKYDLALADLNHSIEVREELIEDLNRRKKVFDLISLAKSYYNRGNILDLLGRADGAKDDYKKALKLLQKENPNNKLLYREVEFLKDRLGTLLSTKK